MKERSCAVHRRAAVVVVLSALASSAPALDTALPPSGNFDLSHWKLTLPTGEPDEPDEILPDQLNDGYTRSPYFITSPVDGAMRFWAPVTGVTTGGSSYPRSELREQISPGHNTPNWYAQGTHVLDAECRIVQVPSSGKVIIGQVHGKIAPGGEDANPLVKLAYDRSSSALRIQVKRSPHRGDSRESTDIVPGISVGSTIKYQIMIVDGVARVTVNGTTYSRDFLATDPDWAETDLYFKAGAYCIDNSGPSSEGAMVDFTALTVSHRSSEDGTAEPTPPPETSPSEAAFEMRANQAVLEAEHAAQRSAGGGRSWQDVWEQSASGVGPSNAVQALANAGLLAQSPGPSSCRADYPVFVPAGAAGSFYVHVRGRGPSKSDDSVFVSLNGDTARFQELVIPGALGWRTSKSRIALPAGQHTLTLWMREDGVIVDRLVVNTSQTPPTGAGPAESPRTSTPP